MNTFEVALHTGQLPEKIEELVPLRFMGQSAVEFYRSKLKAQTGLNMAQDQRAQTLADGQDAGKMLLAIEAQIGEMLRTLPRGKGRAGGGQEKSLPKDIDCNQSFKSQQIAAHPTEVAEVIKKVCVVVPQKIFQ